MYLHIGKNNIINEEKIIGIFNLENIKINKQEKIIDISNGNKKTIILINDKRIKGYITNISSTTLKKREKI